MRDLQGEINGFLARKREVGQSAAQRAALQLLCGIDQAELDRADGAERGRIARRLRRLIERERLRGARRHWSYDLNRHIALKQALRQLEADPACGLRPGRAPRADDRSVSA